MTKNIIIGIGGTGLSAIRELRRLIAERYERGLEDPAVSSVRFLYLDTDREDSTRRNNWTVLGKDISLRQGEKIIVNGDRLGPMVQNPKDFGDVADWLPAISDYVGAPGEGAKGIRPYGRLIYEYSANKEEIKRRIFAARDSLNLALPHEPRWRIYIVCSLSGGTGSGMFLPLAQDLIGWDVFKKDMASQKLRAFLVLPPLSITDRHERYHSNAFAALRELNYKGVENKLPFSNTYLIEPINAVGNEVGLDNLPLMIAQRLFLNIQSGEAAGAIDALMDNENLGALEADDDRRKHALCFSSFGLSTVAYPREIIARSVALEWAAGVVSGWLQERDAPQNVNQVVRNDLPKLRLSRLHVNGDADPFGNQDYPPHETELPNAVDSKIDPLAKRQLGPAGPKVREDLEAGFRAQGIDGFYQQREKDVKRAAEYALNQVRLSVSRQVRDPGRGVRFAKEYLEELRNILEKEFKTEASGRFGEQAQKQIAVFQSNYGETVNAIQQHENAMVYWDSEFARDKSNMIDELKAYLRKRAGYWSAKYAMSLLDQVIPGVQKLHAEMDVWLGKVTDTLGKVRGRQQIALKGRAQDPQENGVVIFNMDVLQKVAREAPPSVVNPEIEQRLRAHLSEQSGKLSDDLDLFALMDTQNPDELIENTAFEFILSPNSPLDVRRTNLYDRFISEYPTAKERQEMLTRTESMARVFVRSVPSEVGRRPMNLPERDVISIPDVIGRLTKDNQEAQNVVRTDLESNGAAPTKIHATQDVERIIFVREAQGFPVRFIESVKRLKDYYEKWPVKEALHIDKREVSGLYDLFLLSDTDRKAINEAEEAFVVARAAGWLTPTKNAQTLKPEIRYEYEVPGRIGTKTANFGPDWETALERFAEDSTAPGAKDGTFREGRVLLSERARTLRKEARTDPAQWGALADQLRNHLQSARGEFLAGNDDPRYVRDMAIINRIQDAQERP